MDGEELTSKMSAEPDSKIIIERLQKAVDVCRAAPGSVLMEHDDKEKLAHGIAWLINDRNYWIEQRNRYAGCVGPSAMSGALQNAANWESCAHKLAAALGEYSAMTSRKKPTDNPRP